MRWPFFHLSSAQNWEIGRRGDLLVLLVVHPQEGVHWIVRRDLAHYEANGWVGRFSYPVACLIAKAVSEHFPPTSWGQNEAFPMPAPTRDFGAGIVSAAVLVIYLCALALLAVLLSYGD